MPGLQCHAGSATVDRLYELLEPPAVRSVCPSHLSIEIARKVLNSRSGLSRSAESCLTCLIPDSTPRLAHCILTGLFSTRNEVASIKGQLYNDISCYKEMKIFKFNISLKYSPL